MSIESEIARIVRGIEQRVSQAAEECAMDLLQKSKDLVPVFSGDLKATGGVARQGNQIQIGYSTDYALRIHEDMSIRHPIHTWNGKTYDCGGQAKYLEQPFRENLDSYMRYIFEKAGNI